VLVRPSGPRDAAWREDQWRILQRAIRSRIHPEQFETWFRRAALAHADGESIQLAVQNTFTRDWLERYYRTTVEEAVREACGGTRRIEFVADPELVTPLAPRAGDPPPAVAPLDNARPAPRVEPDRASHAAVELGLNAKYTFDNFVVGPCKPLRARRRGRRGRAAGQGLQPVLPPRLGRPGQDAPAPVAVLGAARAQPEDADPLPFVRDVRQPLHQRARERRPDEVPHKYRNVDVLVVDDIHVLANKERTQEEFFHTFNTLYQSGKQIVLSSDSPPKDIPTLQERLVSRFKWGLVTEIEPPCYETRMAILKRKSREKGREIPDEVARQVAERVDSNIRELEGAVTKLIGYASSPASRHARARARGPARPLRRAPRPAVDGGDPGDRHELFGVKLSEMHRASAPNAIAYPRQVAMYVARQITRHSLEEIGGFFGGRGPLDRCSTRSRR
jgi:chromosomal replication initiator protein